MDFHNFYIIYVFNVMEFTADIPTGATTFEWSRKSKSTSGSKGTDGTVL